MSQLVVRPGRNAAREAKRIKEIRHVKAAIRWHEQDRKKRQERSANRHADKTAFQEWQNWHFENVVQVRRTALRNAKEDWMLGPLRPNRQFAEEKGDFKNTYGSLNQKRALEQQIPRKTQQRRNEAREKKGLPSLYPLVVEKQLYFPIVKDDRVVIMKGVDRGKVGVVQFVLKQSHSLSVKGLNKQNNDASLDNRNQATEVPLSMDDVRLVIPYEIIRHGVREVHDVVVDEILMERHTTGIDPFTGIDYGDAQFPKDHQYDPSTGLPIFNRYIAGTRHRIEWPWEQEEEIEDTSVTGLGSQDNKRSLFQKTTSFIRHPITNLRSWRQNRAASSTTPSKTTASEPEDIITAFEAREADVRNARARNPPKSMDPKHPAMHDDDTGRNAVESEAFKAMPYTLLEPPFPEEVRQELRAEIKEDSGRGKKEARERRRKGEEVEEEEKEEEKRETVDEEVRKRVKRRSEAAAAAAKRQREREVARGRMKTPMQIRWETERAKIKREKSEVSMEEVLEALGGYLEKTAEMKGKGKKGAKREEVEHTIV